MPLKRIITLLVSAILVVHAYTNEHKAVLVDKVPAWVIKKQLIIPKQIPVNELDNGVYFLDIDNQIKVPEKGKPQLYSHYAVKIVNQKGLDEASQINVRFDPSYQKVILHHLLIHRNGKTIDKTDTMKIHVIQREASLEAQIYDGHLTANIIIDDLRLGDVVEYGYTKIGTNPIYKGMFYYQRYVQWNVPIQRQTLRILWQKKRALHIKKIETDLNIKVQNLPEGTAYTFVLNHTKAYHPNSQTPKWYQPYGIIYFYQSNSWSEIVDWIAPLYQNAVEDSVEIDALIKKITASSKNIKEKVVAVLNYVQSDIRYLGIEMGTSSHKPSRASETLKRRYGDCKDKTVLLLSMLKQLQIKASPALVNTDYRAYIKKMPPTANAFNHVIVKMRLGKHTYWLDPTRSYQKGKLDWLYQPDYGYALVIDKGVNALESMKSPAHYSKKEIYDSFDLSHGPKQDTDYKSHTFYLGYAAEERRYAMDSDGLNSVQKQYLSFYRNYYPHLEVAKILEHMDDKKSGILLQKEQYRISGFWKLKKKKRTAGFYANSIYDLIPKPKQTKRHTPFDFEYPIELNHTIRVKLYPLNWSFEHEDNVINNKHFYLRNVVDYNASDHQLTLKYHYRSKTDHIPAKEIDSYMQERKKARDLLYYGIVNYLNTPKPAPLIKSTSQDSVTEVKEEMNLTYILASIAVLMLAGSIFIFYSIRRDMKKRPLTEHSYYYPISLVKFLALSLISFGLYSAYWFYRNYRYLKYKEGSNIMPLARAIFYLFWYYPLYQTLVEDSQKRFNQNHVLIKPLAVLFAFLFFLANIVSIGEGTASIVALIAEPLFLIPLVNFINYSNKDNMADYQANSRWRLRHIVFILMMVPLFLLSAGSSLGIIPSDKVVNGNSLRSWDIKFIHRKGILPANEQVRYFYSDDWLTLHDDGNGFSDYHLFSYWRDEGKFYIKRAHFRDIEKIEVQNATDKNNDSIITVVKKDGSTFALLVSSNDDLDKLFIKELKKRWYSFRQDKKAE